jgi:hypothetical protein
VATIVASKLLNQYGMLQTHVEHWTRTQRGTIIEQLNCGARALDYRPYLGDNGVLYAHHGPSVILKRMEDTLKEILLWGKANPNELIIMSLSHCVDARFHNSYYADNCHQATVDLLAKHNINTITDNDCSVLDSLTMEDALAKGTILAVFGCSTGYWDPSLTCSSKEYICYDSWPQNTSHIPWQRLTDSLLNWYLLMMVHFGDME